MKQIKLTFWLIGFGCGITVTGIAGALVALNVSENESKAALTLIESVNEVNSQATEEKEKVQTQESVSNSLVNDPEVNINQNKGVESLENTSNNSIEEAVVICELTIPNNVSASEICQILQEYSVVENGNDFLDYIKERKKQTLLKSGHYTLTIGGTYEEILEELIS